MINTDFQDTPNTQGDEAFIYVWFNDTNGREYIGSHRGTEDDGYVSSSTNDEFWDDYRAGQLQRKIIFWGDAQRCLDKEHLLLVEHSDELYGRLYNKSTYTGTAVVWTDAMRAAYSERWTDEMREAKSEITRQQWAENPPREEMPSGAEHPLARSYYLYNDTEALLIEDARGFAREHDRSPSWIPHTVSKDAYTHFKDGYYKAAHAEADIETLQAAFVEKQGVVVDGQIVPEKGFSLTDEQGNTTYYEQKRGAVFKRENNLSQSIISLLAKAGLPLKMSHKSYKVEILGNKGQRGGSNRGYVLYCDAGNTLALSKNDKTAFQRKHNLKSHALNEAANSGVQLQVGDTRYEVFRT